MSLSWLLGLHLLRFIVDVERATAVELTQSVLCLGLDTDAIPTSADASKTAERHGPTRWDCAVSLGAPLPYTLASPSQLPV